jgi:hypothetical protein
MPPFGLYPVPRHHMYGGRTKPRTYNTNDFQDDQGSAAASEPALPPSMDGASESQSAAGETETKKKKAARKEKKRQRMLSVNADKNAELERLLDSAEAVPDKEGLSTMTTKKKKDKKKHRRSEGDASQVTSAPPPRSQKADTDDAGHERCSEKKRKRESEAHSATANAQLANEEYLAVQQLDSLIRFGSLPPKHPRPEAQAVQKPSKKRTKRKSQSTEQNPAATVQSAQVAGPDQSSVSKAKRKVQTAVPVPSKAAAEHRLARVPSPVPSPVPLPVPRDWIDGSDELKAKEQKKDQRNKGLISNVVTPSPVPVQVTKQTPIPFPQLLQAPTTKSTGTKPRKNSEEGLPHSNVLVPETPPSKTPKKTAVPLPPSSKARYGTVATRYMPSKDHHQTMLVSSPTPNGDVPAPSIAPPALEFSQAVPKLPSVPHALTDANLRSFKRPLTDGTEPEIRAKIATSSVTSFPTSSGSISILEAFARVGKPHVRPIAERDPFVTTNDKQKALQEGRERIPHDVFSEKYREVTKIVDFDEEDQYLGEHLEWDAKHNQDAVPCLHKMTGCSAKKEELIRLSKEQNMEILAQLDTPGDDVARLDEATNQAQRAEDLLMLATRARIPVPIGYIEGKWTLYCPKYADTHSDRYGYGQRSLTIHAIAGFKHKNTFTARMHLPPRTMAFSILAFQIPPHASFRATTVKTASEGYTMEMVFLGNGFLHLRADLGRLLTGTIRKPHEDNHVMEFLGVHDQATQWWSEKKDVVEDEGRLLLAKYDGQTIGQ